MKGLRFGDPSLDQLAHSARSRYSVLIVLIRPGALEWGREVAGGALLGLSVRQNRNDVLEGALDTGLGIRKNIEDVTCFRFDGSSKRGDDLVRIRYGLAIDSQGLANTN